MSDVIDHPPYPYDRDSPYDPPPEFARWRGASPVSKVRLWDGREAWLVIGHEDVRTVLRDHESFSSQPDAPGYPSLSPADAAAKSQGMMQLTDPPLHDVLRRAVQREFTVKRIAERKASTAALIDGLLDEMERAGPPIDLVENLAAAVPAQFTCQLLGVPLSDGAFFTAAIGQRFDPTAEQTSVCAADEGLSSYFADVIEDRRTAFRDDLSGRLVRDHLATGEITAEQATTILHVLLIGGFDTTRNMIAMGTLLLLDHRDQLAALQRDDTGWPATVEEMLRYLSVVQYERRAVTRTVELAGHEMRAGDGVLTVLHAANRDPRAFGHADEFDPHRIDNNHLTFGSGLHQCLGQPVARMLLHLTFPKLFARFPRLRLAVPAGDLAYHDRRNIWGPRELPVAW